ncbi:MAG: histidine--tRNA ligase [Candidatus Moraniibacteriota bacterium]|nr:MAG: histidine--tRNA ligase [Candidatus Moranbacteria bacterium]
MIMARKKAAKKKVTIKKKTTKHTTKKATGKISRKKKVEQQFVLQTVRGMRDVLPGDQPYWQQIRKVLEKRSVEYGFSRVDTPVVEMENVFSRSIGEGNDVVKKELYTFRTKGGDNVALRPELTTSVARAYLQHGMTILPKPVKLFSIGSAYRYDRPQEGRFREFQQAEFNIFGEEDPILDAQVMQIAYRVLNSLGVKNIIFHVNSIGTEESRKEYLKLLKVYFRSKKNKLSSQYRDMIEINPIRIFDAKDDKCMQVCAGAPQAIDHLDKDSRDHFKHLLEYLDELDIPYMIDPQLVRGLDYYTRTVFEIFVDDNEERQISLGGGGRFDGLVEAFGGEPTPAIGFAFGIDRLITEMKRVKAKKYQSPQPRVFLAQLGDLAKKKSLNLFANIEQSGILVAESFGRGTLKTQLRHANKLGVELTLIIGQQEALDETVIVKNMITGTQETVSWKKIVNYVKKSLKESAKLVKVK